MERPDHYRVAIILQNSESDRLKSAIPRATCGIIWPSRNTPASSVVFAQNTVDIAAAPETVWALLIDCVRWPSWYKHCSDVSLLLGGRRLGPGSKFRFKTLGFYFEPEVETFDPPRMLVWLAKGPLGSSGAHAWFIERTPEGCRVITEEAQCLIFA